MCFLKTNFRSVNDGKYYVNDGSCFDVQMKVFLVELSACNKINYIVLKSVDACVFMKG